MISEELLYEAVERAGAAILAAQPGPDECQHRFSRKFERRMRRLVRRTDHPIRHWAMQGAAAVLAVALLGGGAALAVSEEARTAFVGWVREVFDTHVSYSYVGEETQTIPEGVVYRPSYIPEGFTEIELSGTDTPVMNLYFDMDRDYLLYFSYMQDAEPGELSVSDGGEGNGGLLEVMVGEYAADLHLDHEENGNSILTWHDPARKVRFIVGSALPGEELIRIAESIVEDTLTLTPTSGEYDLEWLPEGYEPALSGGKGVKSGLVYENGENTILLHYHVDAAVCETIAAQASVPARSVLVEGAEAELYLEPDGMNTIVWSEPDSGMAFWITAPLAAEDMIKLAEGAESLLVHEDPAALYHNDADGTNTLVYYETDSDLIFTISGAVPGEDLIQIAERISGMKYMPRDFDAARPAWAPEGYAGRHISEAEYRMSIAYQKDDTYLMFAMDTFKTQQSHL